MEYGTLVDLEEGSYLQREAVYSNPWYRFTTDKVVFENLTVLDRPFAKAVAMLSALRAPQSKLYYWHVSSA